jgi:hypothetical protein
MLNIDKILSQDRLLKATTGLNRKAFEHLLPRFEQVYHSSLQTSKPNRRRKIGAGRKSHLKTIKHKLFYILFYFKCYPTFDLASILFDFDRSQAHRWTHRLVPVLEPTLGEKKVLPLRQIKTIQEFIQHFPEVKQVIIDGVERPINRPQDRERQKEENQELSKQRVLCENAFAGVKRYNAVSTIYRNRVPESDDHLMLVACGLWNFSLDIA